MRKPILQLVIPALLALTLCTGCHRKHKTIEETLAMHRDGLSFTVILTRPAGSDTRYPGLLLLDGPGEEDIDRSTRAFRKTIRPLHELAQRLAERGATVLRFSKRTALPGDAAARFRYAAMQGDAEAAVRLLAGHRSVDPGRISLIAYGRALPIAIPLAGSFAFRKLFLLAPVFSRIDRHMRFKLHYQLDFYNRHNLRHRLKPLIQQTRRMLATTTRAIPLMHDPEIPADQQILGYPKQFWVDWIKATEGLEQEAMAVRTPLYILYGTRDLETPGSLILQRTLRLRKKNTVQTKEFKGMRHDLYHNPTGSFMTPLAEYIIKEL